MTLVALLHSFSNWSGLVVIIGTISEVCDSVSCNNIIVILMFIILQQHHHKLLHIRPCFPQLD